VSIKPNRTNQGIPLVVFQPGGRMIAANVNIRQVILVAYSIDTLQLVDAPDWTTSERFAIEARTGDSTPTSTIRLMLRSMLAERFNLVAHTERRDLPIVAMTMARPDKRPGPKLVPSGPECRRIRPPEGIPIPPPPPPPPPGAANAAPIRIILETDEPLRRRCGAMVTPGWMSAGNITMQEFTRPLSQVLRRPVINETGLEGEFDLDVIFSPEGLGGALVGPPPASVSDAPSLETALRDDLGIRLESRRGSVEVLVVEKIERPTEN
jgi:uncharacterized protein (TIGR03435 family)